jgi:Helicase associated domain
MSASIRFVCFQVSRSFIVPSNKEWPEEGWGMKLGQKVTSVRAGRAHSSPSCVAKLGELDFIWDPSSSRSDLLLETLRAFKRHNGHLNIDKDFVVPQGIDAYPRDAWGMKLGLRIMNMIYRGDFGPSVREELEKLGLRKLGDKFDTRHWEYIYSALQVYKSLYGNLNVQYNFMVPHSAPWPESIWGLKLGYRLRNIRYRGDFVNERPECRRLLEEIGFNCGKVRDDPSRAARNGGGGKKARRGETKGRGRGVQRSALAKVEDALPPELSGKVDMVKMKRELLGQPVPEEQDV